MMADGHLNKCKECSKSENTSNRVEKRDYYIAYDKSRAKEPHRAIARAEYHATERGKEVARLSHRNYKENYPLKTAATSAVTNALKRGDLIRPPDCSECGVMTRVEGHHDDYAKPLAIRWLCKKCHTAWHLNNDPLNGS